MAKDSNKYVGAPYNFVPLYKSVYKRYKKTDELPEQNKIRDDLYSGEIEYEFVNKTPIFISNGEEKENIDFYKNLRGKYAVPGSTMRGLIENNITVLGFCGVGGDIANRRFLFREVTNRKYNELAKKVKAGYIKNCNGTYKIYDVKNVGKTNTESNYFKVNEKEIWDDEETKKNFNHIIDKLMYDGPFDRNNKKRNYNLNENYNPYYEEISFSKQIFDNKSKREKITYIGASDEVKNIKETENESESATNKKIKDLFKGYVLSSGMLIMKDKNKEYCEKKHFYVIPEKDEDAEVLTIPETSIKAFMDDYKLNEKLIKDKNKNKFYSLPDIGEEKPVFYVKNINNKNVVSFGFTPMIRMIYNNSIHDFIQDEHKNNLCIDYKKAIFGFTNTNEEKKTYKSRVYFEDAVVKDDARSTDEVTCISPATPKASSYMDYLEQKDKGNYINYNYNGGDKFIRGIKQYWMRNGIDKKGIEKCKITRDFSQTLKPIEEGRTFKGKIKFKNLNKDELGLLLWCIKLEEGCDMNIGMGKPYGYGRIHFDNIELKFYDYKEMYNSENISFDNIYKVKNESIDEYICDYKTYIWDNFLKSDVKENNNIRTVEDILSVNTFIKMKSCVPDENKIRYMDIENKEYQSRNKPLPSVDDVLNVNKTDNETENKKEERENKSNKKAGTNNKNNYSKGNRKGKKESSNEKLTYNPFRGINGIFDK